ncbi:acetylcholinesterase-like [Mercenaria mercenaria]|uniref:acetylcholinesterase-like n=1 Tax=Mercenaria mercenaria TaxID=6596 RepID=UPI00234E4653|nr:acetylcholinesterase-like [Mercenaria mercenaria]
MRVVLPVLFTLTYIRCACGNDVTISAPAGEIRGSSVLISFAGKPYRAMSFYGVPYAQPSDNFSRFSKPVRTPRFSETFDATKPRSACPQNVKWAPGLESLPVSEDCLSLDIFVPHYNHVTKPKAVMIFVHGGWFQYGYKDVYKSEVFAAVNDVIYVTINYRLSAYGFLASKKFGLKGNYGLWDQHMAIQWVHDNIAAFGGDPGRVTLFGESAGAVSVMYQALYEGNKGMVHRVIAQSGSVGSYWTYSENPDVAFEDLITRSDCKMNTLMEILKCLRAMNISDLQDMFSYETLFLPVTDGDFVKYNPFSLFKNLTKESAEALHAFADIDVIMGMNSDEGLLDLEVLSKLLGNSIEELSDGMTSEEFRSYTKRQLNYVNFTYDVNIINSLIHQYTDWTNPNDSISRRSSFLDLLKDISYTPSVVQAANAHTTFWGKGSMYMYQFEHRPSFSISPLWIKGANHAEEIPFVLAFPTDVIITLGIKSAEELRVSDDEILLSRNMMKFWTQFAKTGNPNDVRDIHPGMWPEYTYDTQSYIVLNTDGKPYTTGSHFRLEFVNYWTNVFPGLQEVLTKAKIVCNKNSAALFGSSWTLCFSFYVLLLINS